MGEIKDSKVLCEKAAELMRRVFRRVAVWLLVSLGCYVVAAVWWFGYGAFLWASSFGKASITIAALMYLILVVSMMAYVVVDAVKVNSALKKGDCAYYYVDVVETKEKGKKFRVKYELNGRAYWADKYACSGDVKKVHVFRCAGFRVAGPDEE